jgi:acyl transferase domain-containing protein
LLVASAFGSTSLNERIRLLGEYCKAGEVEIRDLAHTLGSHRDHGRHRAFAVTSSETTVPDLGSFQQGTYATPPSSVIFVFPGQGTQWHGMGKELMETFHSFRADIRGLDKALQSISVPPSWTLEGMF